MSIFVLATIGELAGRKVGEVRAGYELMKGLPEDSKLREMVGDK